MKFQTDDSRMYALLIVCGTVFLCVVAAGVTVCECVKLTHPPAATGGR